ncbi:hypothetical protein JKP88DRAFT_244438 [Tribonema minus]|uniref:Uncharacterized protein n=1 Tax=Tribonema minus TaxID=303371 RepID=A0A836CH51_9STRA|nr:hypothetical protein JKP88DRAFT_244438 [Tribonema minus]
MPEPARLALLVLALLLARSSSGHPQLQGGPKNGGDCAVAKRYRAATILLYPVFFGEDGGKLGDPLMSLFDGDDAVADGVERLDHVTQLRLRELLRDHLSAPALDVAAASNTEARFRA